MSSHQRVLDWIERHDSLNRTRLHLLIALRRRQPRWNLIGRHRINAEIEVVRRWQRGIARNRRAVLDDLL